MVGLQTDDSGVNSERLECGEYPVRAGDGEPQAEPGLPQAGEVNLGPTGSECPSQAASYVEDGYLRQLQREGALPADQHYRVRGLEQPFASSTQVANGWATPRTPRVLGVEDQQ